MRPDQNLKLGIGFAYVRMYPLETNRDVRMSKWQHKVRSNPKKRFPAIADRAVWEKVTKGRAGIR